MMRLAQVDRITAIGLSALAGYVDAVGFLMTGGFFVSFMSGNSTRLGVAINARHAEALVAAALIALFVAGVAAGTLLGRRSGARRRRDVLIAVALLLALAILLHDAGRVWLAAGALAFAMGIENVYFEEMGEIRVGLTYMTGRLAKIGQGFAEAIAGGARFDWLAHLLLWGGLLGGAAGGAAMFLAHGADALWLAVAGFGALLLPTLGGTHGAARWRG